MRRGWADPDVCMTLNVVHRFTRQTESDLNAAIRDRLVTAGMVDDVQVATTAAGQRIGVGDQVATRRNDRDLDVANRDTWTVGCAHAAGGLTVTSPTADGRVLPAGYVGAHVELAYATTAHGAQGATATTAHLVLGEHTGAASAYVGMTRGRQANTAHLIATDLDDAREQWVTTFTRNRADLGPDHARREAGRAAARYAQPLDVSELIDKLRQEWDSEARDLARLTAVPLRDNLRLIAQLRREHAAEIAPLEATYRQARVTQSMAKGRADHSETVIAVETEQNREALLAEWAAQRPAAQANARTVLDGPGRISLKLPAVNRANEALGRWSVRWQPIIPTMPTVHADIARFADRADDTSRIYAAVDHHARRQAEVRHPEHQQHAAEAAAADRGVEQVWLQLRDTRRDHLHQLADFGRLGHTAEPDCRLAQVERQIAATQPRLTGTRVRSTRLELAAARGPRPPGAARREPTSARSPHRLSADCTYQMVSRTSRQTTSSTTRHRRSHRRRPGRARAAAKRDLAPTRSRPHSSPVRPRHRTLTDGLHCLRQMSAFPLQSDDVRRGNVPSAET